MVVGLGLVPACATAYVIGGKRWPGHRITYFNGVRSDAKEVKAAVNAWNQSGAHIRFVATSARRAEVKISTFPRHFFPVVTLPGQGKVNLGADLGGYASIGYVSRQSRMPSPSGRLWFRGAHIWLRLPNPKQGLDVAGLTRIAAHEFGHVLGLNHEKHKCALMNGGLMSTDPCSPEPWDGACHLINADDVRGAIALYGGRVSARVRGPQVCPFGALPAAPSGLTAKVTDPSQAEVTFTWTNPPGLSFPSGAPFEPYSIAGRPTVNGYAVWGAQGSCPSTSTSAAYLNGGPATASKPDSDWEYGQSGTTWCFEVAIQDVFNRYGPPAKVWVTFP
jgi:hypothetical protein